MNQGATNSWKVVERKLDLMNEINIYGTNVFSSSGYDRGSEIAQYAIFQLKPEIIYSSKGRQIFYWLRDVTSTQGFSVFASNFASSDLASNSQYGIRPKFLIG